MAKYRVHMVAIAETSVEVEAATPEEAVDAAIYDAPPGANISNDFDMGDWQLASEVWDDKKFDDDCVKVSE